MPAEREVGLDPLFERGEPGVLEPRAGVSGERLGMELDERRAAPQLDRLVEPLRRSLPIAGAEQLAALSHEQLEAVEVELPIFDSQRVARRFRQQPIGPKSLAQLRDIALKRLRRGFRRLLAPEVVDQPVDGDHAVSVQQQDREQRARLCRRQRDRLSVDESFDRPEEAKFQQQSDDRRSFGAPAEPLYPWFDVALPPTPTIRAIGRKE